MAAKGESVPKFPKPTSSDLAKMTRAEMAQYVAASLGRLSNLYPHWLLLRLETPLGIPFSRFIVLWILRSRSSLAMGEIAQAIDLTPRGVSRIVDGLEVDGLVRRAADKKDKRVKLVALTSKGRRFIDGAMPNATKEFSGLFSVLEKSETVELIRLLEILTDHLKAQIDS